MNDETTRQDNTERALALQELSDALNGGEARFCGPLDQLSPSVIRAVASSIRKAELAPAQDAEAAAAPATEPLARRRWYQRWLRRQKSA